MFKKILLFSILFFGFANVGAFTNVDELSSEISKLGNILNDTKSLYNEKSDELPGKFYKILSSEYENDLDDAKEAIDKADVDFYNVKKAFTEFSSNDVFKPDSVDNFYVIAKRSILDAKRVVDDVEYINQNIGGGVSNGSTSNNDWTSNGSASNDSASNTYVQTEKENAVIKRYKEAKNNTLEAKIKQTKSIETNLRDEYEEIKAMYENGERVTVDEAKRFRKLGGDTSNLTNSNFDPSKDENYRAAMRAENSASINKDKRNAELKEATEARMALMAPGTKEAKNTTIKNSLLGITENNIVTSPEDDGLSMLQSIVIWVKDTLMGLIILIAVGAFLFTGIRLAFARGNPEEFKKGMMQFVYAVIGIIVVSLAWATVTLVAGINI